MKSKLVRDKTPHLARARGRNDIVGFRHLDHLEYVAELARKLVDCSGSPKDSTKDSLAHMPATGGGLATYQFSGNRFRLL